MMEYSPYLVAKGCRAPTSPIHPLQLCVNNVIPKQCRQAVCLEATGHQSESEARDSLEKMPVLLSSKHTCDMHITCTA
jgi:hypothetical protein